MYSNGIITASGGQQICLMGMKVASVDGLLIMPQDLHSLD